MTAWRLLAEFAEIHPRQGHFADNLVEEMNHQILDTIEKTINGKRMSHMATISLQRFEQYGCMLYLMSRLPIVTIK